MSQYITIGAPADLPATGHPPWLGKNPTGHLSIMRSTMMLRILPALALLGLAACKSSEPTLFVLRSAQETGITFVNHLTEDDSLYNPLDFDYIYNGAGVGVGDFNGNGLQDLFFGGNMVSSRLYLNQGDFRFVDVTEAAGVGTDVWVTGVTVVDINQDGRPDLYLSVAGPHDDRRANLLFVNLGPDENGIPRFTEEAERYGIADTGYSTHAVFFDYDGDGHLDLYILTNALEQVSRNALRRKMVDGQAESTDRLYRNNGDGTFSDVSREAGILIEGYGLGVVVADLNDDGLPDIYVGNDFITNDLIWINNGDGTFTNRAPEYLKHQTHNAMGVDIADYNNDGLLDIVVLDMLPRDNYRKKMMLGSSNYDVFHMALDFGFEPQYVRNTLQLNNGLGPDGKPSFSEIGQLARIHDTDWSWAPLLADFDNSGLRDLYVTNGYRRDVTNMDYIVYNQQSRMLSNPEERRQGLLQALWALPEVKLPNYIFRNRGDLTFADETEAWGMNLPSFSTGAAFVDLNNNGALDLVVNNIDGEAFVFENRARELRPEHNFFRVALQGPQGNLNGYGAKITLHAGDLQLYHEHTPFRGYKSTVEETVHFGLGTRDRVDSVEIVWPDGSYQLLTNLEPNRVITARHAEAGSRPAAEPHEPAAPERLFQLASARGLDYRHASRPLADFKHTPLLPHKHSQGGPGIAVGDLTGNDLDDVYLGGGRGQEKTVYLQTAPGEFEQYVLEDDLDYEDMGAIFFDADGDGHLDLYVVSGGGFLSNFQQEYQDRLYLNDGTGRLRRVHDALPEVNASGSCVIAADYDGNGKLDLFVCGRIIPGQYPLPPRSYLLRNESEPGAPRFTDVTEEVAPGLANVGLVTSALWTDYDGDGRPDLLVVGEWMPITFFRNEGGRFVDATASTGLANTGGWWNSVVAGDFNNNGRIDYIVGNLGLNTEYRASPAEPVRLYAADFDENGRIDPILSYYIQGKEYPAHTRDVLIEQIIAMRGRFPRYEDYARATMDRTLSPQERAKATILEAVEFRTSFLENLGDGKFELRPLPVRAQVAPTYGMLVEDFDGDGNLDVLLVGNSYATETRTGWYTASTGLVMLGDGQGGFSYADGVRSGFFVEGNARAVAEVMLDDRRSLFLATENNGNLRVLASTRPQSRAIRLANDDAYAIVTFADGRQRRQEFPHGSTYLSQTTRCLRLPDDLVSAVVYDSRGVGRTVFDRQLAEASGSGSGATGGS